MCFISSSSCIRWKRMGGEGCFITFHIYDLHIHALTLSSSCARNSLTWKGDISWRSTAVKLLACSCPHLVAKVAHTSARLLSNLHRSARFQWTRITYWLEHVKAQAWLLGFHFAIPFSSQAFCELSLLWEGIHTLVWLVAFLACRTKHPSPQYSGYLAVM